MPDKPIQYNDIIAGQEGDAEVSQAIPFATSGDTLLEDLHLQQTINDRYATNEALVSIRASIDHMLVLNAPVASVNILDGTVCLICYLSTIEVRIPFRVAFATYPADITTPASGEGISSLQARQIQYLSKFIGSTLSFIAVDIKNDGAGGYYALGNRVLALQATMRKNFLKSSGPLYTVGQVVNAEVLSVSPASMYINVLGVDLRLLLRDVSIRYLPDLPSYFSSGDTIPVAITSLKVSGNKISLEVSGRRAAVELAKPNLRKVRIGGRYKATVTSNMTIRRDDKPLVTTLLFLEGVELPAFANVNYARAELHPGDSVYFEVAGVAETGYVHGSIIRYINRR